MRLTPRLLLAGWWGERVSEIKWEVEFSYPDAPEAVVPLALKLPKLGGKVGEALERKGVCCEKKLNGRSSRNRKDGQR